MTNRFTYITVILYHVIGFVLLSYTFVKADSLTVGNTVDLVGTLNIKPAGSILFSDGSFINSALNLAGGSSSAWGSIIGTITSQLDLMAYFGAKENSAYKGVANGYASLDATGKVPASQLPAASSLAWGNITGSLSSQNDLSTALSGKENLSSKGIAYGYPSLDINGKVPIEQLPLLPDVSAVWGEITGLIANQADLAEALALKQDMSEKGSIFGYASLDHDGKIPVQQIPLTNNGLHFKTDWAINDETIVWHVQGAEWQNFIEPMTLAFEISDFADLPKVIRVRWSDNVGIYNNRWCNVALFLDQNPQPICSGSWSGVYGTSIFNEQYLLCEIPEAYILPGVHLITALHRSEYCAYGNYAFDGNGAKRTLIVED